MTKITKEAALLYHSQGKPGKIEVVPTKPYQTQRDLSLAYSPGVAEPCLEIQKNPDTAYDYTDKGNLVAVISNGTAVLGLGDIGAMSGKPVMEGKGLLFKIYAGIDVFDIEVNEKDPDKFIEAVKAIAPTFGGINLEDIKAPECFKIEQRLKEELDIPVMHDDQHGTAIISSAGLLNALKVAGKKIEEVKIVVNGAGASAVSCTKLYVALGARLENIVMLDSKGVISKERTDLNEQKKFFATDRTDNVIGQWLSDLLQLGIDALTGVVDAALTAYGINPVVHSLIIDGVFAGVGSVLVFLPIIVTLFFFLSILEDTGYMARVAFVMDKPLRKIGLSGRSIVPMLIGFGCSVPAIMATRTVSSDRDRKMTILLTPYMSCSAKISIYAFFTAAFFPRYRALVMLGLYVLGILIGILAALIMNKTAFRGKPVPFVMELPNYRMPGLKSVALLLWEKAKDFLQRAFTVIFLATIIIWFLQSFDTRLNVVADSANSLLALIGQFIAPVFRPLGFGDWRCATALISGFIAKESVVSTLQVLLGGAAISSLLTTRSAISFLVFTLLYTPCVAAIATIRRELDSRLKTVGVVVLQCSVAWVVALAAYAIAGLV